MNDRPNFAEAEMDDQEEGRVVEGTEIAALTQLNAAEINQQIMTARAYPRSIVGFRRNMREMVTYDQPTALSCLYSLKRGNKMIEGPSIRFAEAAVQAWGNVRVGARIVNIDAEFITGQGFFYDLEKNTAIAVEVMRRITNREGERFGDDMIGVTGNAACSIALRNAILRGIPKTAWLDPYRAARSLSIGEGESISVKREEMIKAFAPLNVSKEQIFGLLGVKGLDDVSYDNLMFLAGILNSIKEGEEKAEVVFALENMVNPDQVTPRGPQRNDFKGADKTSGGKQGGTGTGTKESDKAPAEQRQQGTGDGGGQQKQQPAEAQGPSQGEQDRLDMIADLYKRLEAVEILKKVADLREEGINLGMFASEDEEQKWVLACNAKGDALVAAKKRPK